MPYLNWRNASLTKTVETRAQSGSHREFRLTLKLDSQQIGELLPYLDDIYYQGGAELRVDLPDEWILFWKQRAGESRLLMAHPQPEEWVSTLALNETHGRDVIQALKALTPGQSFSIENLGTTGSMTNVELLISHG